MADDLTLRNNTVSISFGGFDNTNDNTIMFNNPFYIAGVVNKVSELENWEGLVNFHNGDDVVVFVRNVNDPNIYSGTVPYRGSFYKYIWNTSNWMQLVLGNHSHSNMEILNQLGEINTSEMSIGEKKVLTFEKISDDEDDENIRRYSFKLEYEDIPQFPTIPEEQRGRKIYLTTDADGKYVWENNFTPAQTFKYVKVDLSTAELTTQFTGNPAGSKSIILSKAYMVENEIVFDPDMNDTVLVYDSGKLVSDIVTTYLNGALTITIDNDEPSCLFELGEKIAILFIRNGITGIIDTIEKQYITKAEAANLMSCGMINLRGYATKADLKAYAAKVEHTHSNYLHRNDYDAFDFRYADYQHTHAEYISKADVLSILVDMCDDDGNIDLEGTISALTTELEARVEAAIALTYTKAQIESLITQTVIANNNTDNISVEAAGMTLTDYLQYLDDKEAEVEDLESSKVLLDNAIRVNLGDGEHIGGYNNGDIIAEGTSLDDIIHKLVSREKIPTVIQPKVEIKYTVYNVEAGATSNITVIPTYTANDAGSLRSLLFKIYKNASTTPYEVRDITDDNGEAFTLRLPMNAYNSDNDCYRFELVAEYKQGRRILSNMLTEYTIDAGTISTQVTIKNKRLAYIGALDIDIEEINPLTIYNALYSTENNLLYEYDVDADDIKNGIRKVYSSDENVQTIVFAVPYDSDYDLNKIMFENQNFDMMDDFEYNDYSLYDASFNLNNNINNSYRVYYYKFAKPIQNEVSILYKLVSRGE